MTRKPNENQSRRAVPSALLAVALLTGPGVDHLDQSLQMATIRSVQVGEIRQGVQAPAPESVQRLQSFFSKATRIQLQPWSSSSTLSIVPEPTLRGKAQVIWGGSIRLAIRY